MHYTRQLVPGGPLKVHWERNDRRACAWIFVDIGLRVPDESSAGTREQWLAYSHVVTITVIPFLVRNVADVYVRFRAKIPVATTVVHLSLCCPGSAHRKDSIRHVGGRQPWSEGSIAEIGN